MFAPLAQDEATEKHWWDEARCNDSTGASTGLFFSEELQEIAQAKAICAECPMVAPCLEGALTRREPWGVWGGQLIANGRILAHKRRRGRPPKVPRPGDVLPQIAVPVHLRKQAALAGLADVTDGAA